MIIQYQYLIHSSVYYCRVQYFLLSICSVLLHFLTLCLGKLLFYYEYSYLHMKFMLCYLFHKMVLNCNIRNAMDICITVLKIVTTC
jgi:hypothetical protein